jgi:N-acetylmuramoyl-L-alanine amidase
MFSPCIDPGHGGRGWEPVFNLSMALLLRTALIEKYPEWDIEMTRELDLINPSRPARAEIAMMHNAQFTLSIHANASPTGDPREHGPLWFYKDEVGPEKQIGKTILDALFGSGLMPRGEYIEEGTGRVRPMKGNMHQARPVGWTRRSYSVLRHHGSRPAGLLECDYYTNPKARAWLESMEGKKQLVVAMIAGLETAEGLLVPKGPTP